MWTEQDRAIMGDIYRMLQHHADPEDTETFWDGAYDAGNDILRRYKGSMLAENMVVAAWSHFESVIKSKQ